MKNLQKIFFIISFVFVAFAATAQRIAVLSDVHITPGNASEPKLRQAVREINSDNYDMVMMIGDLTNEGSDIELANVKAILDSISHPLYVIPGNHESTWSQSATATFLNLWGNDRFVAEVDSLIVIAINCGPYMKMGDGHIKTEDLAWLRDTLRQRVTPGKKVLSVNHYPPNSDLDSFAEYAAALAEFPVIAHINGHYHRWIPYTAGNVDGALPGAMVRALDMRNGDYGYSIIDIDPQWIHIYEKPIGKNPVPKIAYPVATDYKKIEYTKPQWTSPAGFDVKQVWADKGSVFTRVAVDDNNIYFGNSLGEIKAVGKRDSVENFVFKTSAPIFARPLVVKPGEVAFPCSDGIIIYNEKNGKLKTLPSKEGPYVADGIMTPRGWVQGGYKRIELRDPRNYKVRWEYDSIFNYCQAAPAVDGDDLVFGAWDTNLRCLDLKTGKLRWVWNNGKTNNLLGPGNVVPVIAGDKVIIVAPDRYMTAIDRATGKTIWRDNSHRYREALGHSEDGKTVYAKTMDGELVAVDATSPAFSELWTLDMGLGYEHAPCIVLEKDGVVYAGSRRGIVTAVDPVARKVLWQLPLGTGEVNGFDIDPTTGDIYASLIEGTIFRISKK